VKRNSPFDAGGTKPGDASGARYFRLGFDFRRSRDLTFRDRKEGMDRKFVAEMSFGRTGAEAPLLAPPVEIEAGVFPVGVMGLPLLKKTREAAETGLSPFLLSLGVRVGNSEDAAAGCKAREYC
jgi:hypothetical protein